MVELKSELPSKIVSRIADCTIDVSVFVQQVTMSLMFTLLSQGLIGDVEDDYFFPCRWTKDDTDTYLKYFGWTAHDNAPVVGAASRPTL